MSMADKITELGGTAVWESVQQYYGQQYHDRDLEAQCACQLGVSCQRGEPPLARHVQQAFALVHKEVTLKYFGCGPVIPEALEGSKVLDLGSGSGRDCFALSKLIGPSGQVVGIDMTKEQLEYARSFVDYHTEKFGYSQPNVDFRFGYIEKLADAGIKDNSFDLIISNCVVCLCPDKGAVLAEAFRVLKDGGEMYFSDMYTDRPFSQQVKDNHVLWGECISGALQWQDLYTLAQATGFSRPRTVSARRVDTTKFDHLLDGAKVVSVTFRLFKLPSERKSASVVTYLGGIEGCEDGIKFDHATAFVKDLAVLVDAEMATILASSRFRNYFRLSEATDCHREPNTADPKIDPVRLAEEMQPKCNSATTVNF